MNNSNNSNHSNNNNVINNFNNPIFQIGTENITSKLTMEEKKMILDKRDFSIDKIVEIVHCGTYHQFKNIVITNLKDDFAFTYDAAAGYFIKTKMDDTIYDLINHRLKDIEEIYNELKDANKIDHKTKVLLQCFLDDIKDECPEEDYENPDTSEKYKSMKNYKIESVKIFIYNNQDKITKDIALLIQ